MEQPNQLELNKYYAAKKKQVDLRLKLLVDEMVTPGAGGLNKALRHTVLAGGKRTRPILAMAVYELFREDSEVVLDAACALELIHAGALMLDDLPCMDNASLRRGRKTSHLLFGESTTILASAALWIKAFGILSSKQYERYVNLATDTAKMIGSHGLILGQYYDLEERYKTYPLKELTSHYELKTASMFRLAVKYGAVLGGASKAQLRHLDDYALHLGLAFQIRDDIIDATRPSSESGKDAHLDEKNHKQNFINTVGLEASQLAFTEHLAAAKQALQATGLKSGRTYILESILAS